MRISIKNQISIENRDIAKNRRPTLKTISKLSGLSLSSVSLALRNDTSLKSETRDKIRKIARDIGYVPDRAGVRLRTGKTYVVNMVLPSDSDSSGFSHQLIQGVGAGLRNSNYHLSVMPEFAGVDPVENIKYILENHTADGVILTHTEPRDERVKMLMDSRLAFVTNGRTEFFGQHPFQDTHAENFARMAVERLVSNGCKNLMLVIGKDETLNRQYIVNTFNRTIADLSVLGQVLTVFKNESLVDSIDEFSRENNGRPDGIICNEEFMGVIVCHANLLRNMAKLPEFQIVSRESSGILPMLFPEADTIEDDHFAAGKELVRILLLQFEGETDITKLQSLGEPIPHWRSSAD